MKKLLLIISLTTTFVLNSQTWTAIFTPGTPTGTTSLSNATIDDISFIDDNKGIISLGYVYHLTTDGGATWTPEKDFNPYPLMYSVYYYDAQTILVSGGGYVYKSTDAGSTFSQQTNPVSQIRDIDFNGSFGVLVDGYCKAAYSSDGGTTWATVSHTLLCNNLSTLKIAEVYDTDKAIIVGANNNAFITTNSGATWSPFSVQSSSNISDISFSDNQNGVCSASGVLYKTTDGGSTWTSLSSALSTAGATSANAVYSVNANIIYASNANKIYKSTNGGTSFSLDYTQTSCTSCPFLDFTKGGNSLFATVDNGGSHPKAYKTGLALTDINDLKNNVSISVYPNPANQSIQIKGVDLNEEIAIKIISIDGKIMKDEIIHQSNITISDLNSGMYFMELRDVKGKTGVTKFIKE